MGTAPEPAQRRVDAGDHCGQRLVQDRQHHPEPAPCQPGAVQRRCSPGNDRAVTEVVLKPHPGLRDPGTVDPAIPCGVASLNHRHCPATGTLRPLVTHGHELFVGNIGPDLAQAVLNPFLDLVEIVVDDLRPAGRLGAQAA